MDNNDQIPIIAIFYDKDKELSQIPFYYACEEYIRKVIESKLIQLPENFTHYHLGQN